MLLIIAFVSLTHASYPLPALEWPVRRCQGRRATEEYVWQDKPTPPLLRPRSLRNGGRCKV